MTPTKERFLPVLLSALLLAAPASGQSRLRESLPVEIAATVLSHAGREAFNLSPDGQWLAHTVFLPEVFGENTGWYTATGVPLAEGRNRPRARLTNTVTGEVIELGSPIRSSWGAVWAPDGKRVAFYSDEGGEAGLWVWELATRQSQRLPGIAIRPYFGFELIRWTADAKSLLFKVVPEGLSVRQANALSPINDRGIRFAVTESNGTSVFVLRAHPELQNATSTPGRALQPEGDATLADLAIVDLQTHAVERIAKRLHTRWYAFSPDGRYVAFTDLKGWEDNSQQADFDVRVYDLRNELCHTVATHVRLRYGMELSWSPDSRRLAYFEGGQLASQAAIVSAIGDGEVAYIPYTRFPVFDTLGGKRPPIWGDGSGSIYAVGTDGRLWSADLTSGRVLAVAQVPGHRITGIVSRQDRSEIWTPKGRDGAWVIAVGETGSSGIYRLDLKSGATERLVETRQSYRTIFNLASNDRAGTIAYVVSDQRHTADSWLLDTRTGRAHQVTHLNPSLDRYAVGEARLIHWQSLDGQELRGTLLLPPHFMAGRRVPLVAWVYGGQNGSEQVNTFGLWPDTPAFNFQVLATRGYAVLYPDLPVGTGTIGHDLVSAVIPALNVAIKEGYADPDRLAVAGQSYGSYCVLELITRTNRFRAAIISAADIHPDLVSDYLQMGRDGSSTTIGYYEHGQGRMGGTPWEYADRFRSNSPIFSFDKIQAPVLIGQGAEDGTLVAADAIFVGLRRLGKDVEYRIYPGESHVISQTPHVIDFWKRRIEFLDEHLDILRDAKGEMLFDGDRPSPREALRSPPVSPK